MIDLIRMRRRVRKPLGMLDEDDTDLLNDDIDEYLNMAYWEVQDKFPFREKERTGTFSTQAGIRNYEMPRPFEAVQSIAVLDPVTKKHVPLDLITASVYEGEYDENTSAQGIPQQYLREDCFARFIPTPDKAYTIILRRLITLLDLSEANPTIPIPQVWNEILIYGAVWRAFIDFGDLARANAMKAHQVSLINTIVPTEQKELGDTSRAGLEVIRGEY